MLLPPPIALLARAVASLSAVAGARAVARTAGCTAAAAATVRCAGAACRHAGPARPRASPSSTTRRSRSATCNEQRRIVLSQLKASNVTPPPADVLDKQVLERLITERALLQYAKETASASTTRRSSARSCASREENKLTPDEFRKVLEREEHPLREVPRGHPPRGHVSSALREREVDSKVAVIGRRGRQLSRHRRGAGGRRERVPAVARLRDGAGAGDARRRSRRGASARGGGARADQGGQDFARGRGGVLRRARRASGGNLGWRTPARLPSVFVEVGAHDEEGRRVARCCAARRLPHRQARRRAQPQRADGRRADARAPHPRSRSTRATSEAEGKAKIDRISERIDSGAKFEDQARVNSEDASSAKGGDLGWISPGDTVPDFERRWTSSRSTRSRRRCARRSAGT